MTCRVPSLLFALFVSTAAPTLAQTCDYPWTPDHDANARFEVGRFYRSPYSEIIEVLADVCLVYDTILDDGTETRICGARGFAVRNVQGRALLSTQHKTVVWFNGTTLAYPSAEIVATKPVGTWGKLPVGCYPQSAVVSVQDGGLQVRAR